MFSDLKQIVDLLRSIFQGLSGFKKRSERRHNIVGLLKVCFLIKDILADGRNLLLAACPEPTSVLAALEPEAAHRVLMDWQRGLKKQRTRLLALNDISVGNTALP